MIAFETIILQFGEQGEKTGWSYVHIAADMAHELKPNHKKSFRVKGMLDNLPISGIALMPMGDGSFILALKADIRKALRKNAGAPLKVRLEEDLDYNVEIPDDLQECFDFEPSALSNFNSLPKSHLDYFIKWINSAKTNETRAKRIVNTINALIKKWGYGEMIRDMKGKH
jgi:hypothetical protein